MVVFEEYLRSKSALSVLFQEEYFDLKTVQNYLKSKPEFAWMVDIRNRQYENVNHLMFILPLDYRSSRHHFPLFNKQPKPLANVK